MEHVFWWLFLFATSTQFVYLIFVFGRFAFFYKKKPDSKENFIGVSVVIAAKNEYKHLENLITMIMAQQYPVFELVLVNDCSQDASEDLLIQLSKKFKNLKVINVRYTPDHVTGKKYALSHGIKASKHEIVLLTDADCVPVSKNWIKLMSAPLRNQNKIFALGHGSYKILPGLLNKVIQFETLLTALYYFSFGQWRFPFMGIGRNLCYRKDFFINKKGFKDLWHIQGGDDDLFVNRHANAENTAIVVHPESITLSEPKTNFKDYFTQKKRHFHVGKYYKSVDKLKLGIYSFSNLIFWFSSAVIIILSGSLEPIALVLGLVLSKGFLQYMIIREARKKLEGAGKVFWTMFFDLMYLIYFWIIGTRGYLSKSVKWK
ncbi:MAG: glycosyltransferase [Cyclobacteriaceae bacterium]